MTPDNYAGDYNLTQKRWEPEIDGERHTLAEWSKITGVSWQLMIDRHNRGWSWEEAIYKSARKYRDNKERKRETAA